jgi:hypothetical protein
VEIQRAAAVIAAFSGSCSAVGTGLVSRGVSGVGSGLESGCGSIGFRAGAGTGTKGGSGSDFGYTGL